jgi:hypothetical protein
VNKIAVINSTCSDISISVTNISLGQQSCDAMETVEMGTKESERASGKSTWMQGSM